MLIACYGKVKGPTMCFCDSYCSLVEYNMGSCVLTGIGIGHWIRESWLTLNFHTWAEIWRCSAH